MRPSWIILPILTLIASLVILYPNFAARELELVINPDAKALSPEEKSKTLNRFQQKWTNVYNKDKTLAIQPAIATSLPAEGKYLIKGKYLTSALMNRISQENNNLFLESKNNIKPLAIENFLRDGKSLAIKLGLDLQGGMRVVLKGNFSGYVSRLKQIYAKEMESLQKTIVSEKNADKKKEAEERLEDIESLFQLTPERKVRELQKAKLIIDNRLTNQNLTEPQVRIQKEQDAIEVALPGVSNSEQILEILQSTETVEYRLEEPSVQTSYYAKIQAEEVRLMAENKRNETDIVKYQKIIQERLGKNSELRFLESLEEKYQIPTDKYKLFALWARGKGKDSLLLPRRFVILEKAIALSGNDLTDARPYYNPDTYNYSVSFSLTPNGTEKFFQLTKNNKGRNLAIVWGGKVVSNPRINDPIAGGRAEITGSFTNEEANRLSNVISEGALPIELTVLEIRFIGPTLGIESIEVGLKSVVIGFLFVMVYMLVYYRMAGIVADIALLANLIILMALLTLLNFTLTLPGFAGVILTVGMAVDANVIIYERIREEIADGKSLTNAVTLGFQNAFWTIVDANVTTLIAGFIMIRLGNGPIKGFAITLCWGIITSMFTSLLFSRLMMEILVNQVGIKKLSIGFKNPEAKNV
ncbi:MAG: protein translocase subunit SecD [Spirochaetota bacterium]